MHSPQEFVIYNANIVVPTRVIERGALLVRDGEIADVADSRAELERGAAVEVDVRDAYLVPGVVDLHNDSLETEINPRPGANLPVEFALANFERRLAAAGVTTEFHAISFMELERSDRTIDRAAARTALILELRDRSRRIVDHHVLHRLDVWHPHAMDAIFDSVHQYPAGYLSLNDHTPGQGQYRDVPRYVEFMKKWRAQRGGEQEVGDEVEARMTARSADRETIPAVYSRVKEELARRPFVVATHDDDSPEKVDRQWEIGATVAEFPITVDAARRARERGMTIVVGAPNIVRGGSTSGNQDARELFSLGLADVICADYHAPSLLLAAFNLVSQGIVELPQAINSISLNAARAVGLTHVGALVRGQRADIAVVRVGDDQLPHVETLFRGGEQVFSCRAPEAVGAAAW